MENSLAALVTLCVYLSAADIQKNPDHLDHLLTNVHCELIEIDFP